MHDNLSASLSRTDLAPSKMFREVEQLAVFQHVVATLKEIQNPHITKFQLTKSSERCGCIGSDELILHQTTITEFVQSVLWVARRHVFTMFQL
jgi:hypothetical protein